METILKSQTITDFNLHLTFQNLSKSNTVLQEWIALDVSTTDEGLQTTEHPFIGAVEIIFIGFAFISVFLVLSLIICVALKCYRVRSSQKSSQRQDAGNNSNSSSPRTTIHRNNRARPNLFLYNTQRQHVHVQPYFLADLDLDRPSRLNESHFRSTQPGIFSYKSDYSEELPSYEMATASSKPGSDLSPTYSAPPPYTITILDSGSQHQHSEK